MFLFNANGLRIVAVGYVQEKVDYKTVVNFKNT